MSDESPSSFELRWPEVHRQLNSENEETIVLEGKYLDDAIAKGLKSHRENDSTKKRRDSLIRHLQKIFSTRFKGSNLQAFGSSQTGLNLRNGDVDLCLIINSKDVKKILKRMRGILNDQGMEDIITIPRARIPIVKFRDPRSGFEVDIAINNSLALHNTKLLKAYAECDPRLKDLILIVKHWALQRAICDAYEGTFSSYGWTLLAIAHAQMIEPNLAPNLQLAEEREEVKIGKDVYDVTVSEQISSGDSKCTTGELLAGFFERFANSWNWDEDVISIANGGSISRKEKGWKYGEPDAIEAMEAAEDDTDLQMGHHHLSIEDPLDKEHDLCRVVRPEGELTIRNELLRAARMVAESKPLVKICEVVRPERFKNEQPEDLFHDLRTQKDHEIKSKLENITSEIETLTTRMDALENERASAIRMARAMRGIIEETGDIRKKHKDTIIAIRKRGKDIDAVRKKRDLINRNVVIPVHMIEEELLKLYNRLTAVIDRERVPSLNREKDWFSLFFELQQMHIKACEAGELHKEFITLSKSQRQDISQLRNFESEHDDVTKNLLDEEVLLKEEDVSKSGMKSWDKRANSIMRALRQRRNQMHSLRREKGRLEAWMRKDEKTSNSRKGGSKSHSRGTGNRREYRGPSKAEKEEIRKKAASGATISLGDLDTLLSSGGLKGLTSDDSNSGKKQRKKKSAMKNLGDLSAHRGSRNRYSRKD